MARKYVIIDGRRYEATSYGLMYRPLSVGGTRHRCRECLACQGCSEDRCRVCRGRRAARRSVAQGE